MAYRSMCDPANCWLCNQTPEGKTCTHPNEGEVLVAKRNRFGGYWLTKYHMWCKGHPPKQPKRQFSGCRILPVHPLSLTRNVTWVGSPEDYQRWILRDTILGEDSLRYIWGRYTYNDT